MADFWIEFSAAPQTQNQYGKKGKTHMDMIPTAKDIRGPSPLVAIENEAPARQMKKIEAVIVPSNLDAVRKELERRGIRCGMTVVDVQHGDSQN
jgi:hypothetical protein